MDHGYSNANDMHMGSWNTCTSICGTFQKQKKLRQLGYSKISASHLPRSETRSVLLGILEHYKEDYVASRKCNAGIVYSQL
jgi:hypothetical protein